MPTILCQFARGRLFATWLCLALALYFAAQFNAPLKDHDPLIYVLVGKGIYQHGLLPYDFAFDHKPLLIYFFYGLLSFLDVHLYVFQAASAVLLAVSALLVWRLFLDRSLGLPLVLFVVAAFAVGSVGYSGNSELLFVPFELVAIHFALRSRDRSGYLLLSAMAAVAAFNINYVCGVALFPALVFSLWTSSRSVPAFAARLAAYGLACILLMGALLLAAFIGGMDVARYFDLQRRFLTGYASETGAPDAVYLAKLAILAAPGLLALFPVFEPARRNAARALALLLLGSAATLFLSGKFFPHYLYTLAAPAAVIVLMVDYRSNLRYGLLCVAVTLVSLAYVAKFVSYRGGEAYVMDDFLRPYLQISDIVGTEKVMSMRAPIEPLYYSGATPFQPLVWMDHAEIIHGAGEDGYYRARLAEAPVFVMTDDGWCAAGGRDWASCEALADGYARVLRSAGDGGLQTGYELYRRNAQPAGAE